MNNLQTIGVEKRLDIIEERQDKVDARQDKALDISFDLIKLLSNDIKLQRQEIQSLSDLIYNTYLAPTIMEDESCDFTLLQ